MSKGIKIWIRQSPRDEVECEVEVCEREVCEEERDELVKEFNMEKDLAE